MNEVSIRDLRNRGGDVVARVVRGERLVVTRDGTPVAELRPVARKGLPAELLLAQWSKLPALDEQKWRHDVDQIVDASL
jgi:prevent-host-death family protein